MAECYLGLGSNVGEEVATLAEAIRRLRATPGIQIAAQSSLYRTPPWGEPDQAPFVNAAIRIETDLPPHALLAICLDIEQSLGRVRERRWGPRSIDIDILAYGDVVMTAADLVLPHPYLFERAFALAPLAEIAPDLVVAGRSVSAELARVDRGGMERLTVATAARRVTA